MMRRLAGTSEKKDTMKSPEVETSNSQLSGNVEKIRRESWSEMLGELEGIKINDGRLHSSMGRKLAGAADQ
jgi:hypothetical protein